MKAKDAIRICNLLKDNNIEVWIDGGWGIDALLGEQTRPHSDLDIAVGHEDVKKLRNILINQGYKDKKKEGTTEWNFVMENNDKEIDVHVFEFDDKGNNIYGIEYPKESLTGTGTIIGQTVNCISPEFVIKFHENYEPKEKDYKDIAAVCSKFKLKLPANYKNP